MGGPIEKFIEPLGEKILAWLFPVFRDRNEIKIGMNHFLTHVWVTMSLSAAGFFCGPMRWVALASVILVPIAEHADVKNGRWVDVWTRGAGWLYGAAPALVSLLR